MSKESTGNIEEGNGHAGGHGMGTYGIDGLQDQVFETPQGREGEMLDQGVVREILQIEHQPGQIEREPGMTREFGWTGCSERSVEVQPTLL